MLRDLDPARALGSRRTVHGFDLAGWCRDFESALEVSSQLVAVGRTTGIANDPDFWYGKADSFLAPQMFAGARIYGHVG